MPVYNPNTHNQSVKDRITDLNDQLMNTIQTGEFEMVVVVAQKVADQLVLLKKSERVHQQNLFVTLMSQFERSIWKTKKSQRTILALDKMEDVKQTLNVT